MLAASHSRAPLSATIFSLFFFFFNPGFIADGLYWVCWWETALTPVHMEYDMYDSWYQEKFPFLHLPQAQLKVIHWAFWVRPLKRLVSESFSSVSLLFFTDCVVVRWVRGDVPFSIILVIFQCLFVLFWGGRTPPCVKIFCYPCSALLMLCFWLTGVRWREYLIPSPWQLHTWRHAGPGR